MNKSNVVTVQEDENGDLVLPLSDEQLTYLGLNQGDHIEWVDNNDGSFTLKKAATVDTEWVLVEAISTFRERYMVEVPKGKAEYALDTVTMEEAKEFSQEHLGETIVSHRVLSKAEALALCDTDNDYTAGWEESTKVRNFFTTIGDQVGYLHTA